MVSTTLVLLAAALLAAWGGLLRHAEAGFVRPPPFTKSAYQDNPRHVHGEAVDFAWETNITSPLELLVFMEYPRLVDKPEYYYLKTNVTRDVTTLRWIAELFGREAIVPWGQNAVCYLGLAAEGAGAFNVKFYSAHFNISIPDDVRMQANKTTSDRTRPLGSDPPSSSSSSTSLADLTSGMPALGVAGIAIGSFVVFVSAFVFAYLCWRRGRRRRRRSNGRARRTPATVVAAGAANAERKGYPVARRLSRTEVRMLVSPSPGRESFPTKLKDVKVRSSELYSKEIHELP
ncbi:hypothetical protein AAL_02396 [Moelleriella libera RCEF 2490]|uniref:Uncharacterized protein n=1 Tax=Moelleriella libera RCEF 2490 TaxID=1081109 RepID=A0A168EIW6_9HYPO|nr:hypothetical protein AAL_02396 [Moelleriella libera RCEF 2490]